ncbi:MAG: type I restriction enzyme HsdR N-terminal domain-containing protein [Desulfatitalea sp.]
MNDHHLILGQLVDFITGRTIDDTHDERYRQKIARLLVDEKGFAKTEIRPNHPLTVRGKTQSACVPITYIIDVEERMTMLVHYGPGSLVTRHRPALALARLAAPYQIPLVVVTNGETADLLDGPTGRIVGTGLAGIPSKVQLADRLQDYAWEPITAQRAEMEARIVMAYEVDDRCPCDDTVCRWEEKE